MHRIVKKQLALAALIAVTTGSVSYSLSAAADAPNATPRAAGAKVSRAADSAGQYVDDVAITTSVKTRLIANDTTKARDIKVETRNGVVKLSGQVDSSRELRKAESIARSVDGVQFIKNDLKLKAL